MEALFFVLFGELVTSALLGDDMHDNGAVEGGRLAESLFHTGDIMTVERTDVAHAQRLEETPGVRSLPG